MSLRSRISVGAGETSIIRKTARLVLYTGLATGLAGALALGSSATAGAAPLGPGNPPGNGAPGFPWWGGSHSHHGYGTTGVVVTAPGTSLPASFTMTTGDPSTTVIVDVSTTTTLDEPGQSSPGLGGILSGDKVVVFGTGAGTGTIDATSVEVPLARDTGTVAIAPATSTATSFTITTGDPSVTVTVNLSSNPTYREPGFSTPSVTNIMAGDRVSVSGTQDGTNTVTATYVDLPRAMDFGTVATAPASATATTFTITTTGRTSATVIVTVTGTTTYRDPGVSSPTLADVVATANVLVIGTQEGTGAVTATSVFILPAGAGHGFPGGQGGPFFF